MDNSRITINGVEVDLDGAAVVNPNPEGSPVEKVSLVIEPDDLGGWIVRQIKVWKNT